MMNFGVSAKRRLRRAGLVMALALALGVPMAQADTLSEFEQRFFLQTFENEPRPQRLERLEIQVFGQAQSGSVPERESRLLTSLQAAQSKVPAPDTPEPPSAAPPPPTYTPMPAQPAPVPQPAARPDATNYPTVVALERRILGQDFSHEDIGQRLNRLETRVFNRTFGDKPFIDRVDQLLARFPDAQNQAPAVASAETVTRTSPGTDWTPHPEESTSFSGSGRDVYIKIDELERSVFGQAYPSHLVTERLDALEDSVLGHRYQGQSIDNRVDRLIRNYRVETASGYQTRPGVKSRPGFRNPDGSYSSSLGSSYTPSGSRPPQNIQIGGGFYSRSSTRFSPELIEMLPPDARAAVTGQSGGYMAQAPGTVIIQQQDGYPGFQSYGGSGSVQYRSYYNAPGYSQSVQQSTTVIGPDGSQTIYMSPQALPPGGYTGNPATLQSLNDLEIKLYGKVTGDPFPVRLARLENSLMGQSYAGYPDEQRVANLQKAYQYQSLSRVLGNTGGQEGSATLGIPLPQAAPGSSLTPSR